MRKILLLTTALFSVFLLSACKERSPYMVCDDQEITMGLYGDLPDINEYCEFYDFEENKILYNEDMIIDSTVDHTTPGTYQITIHVMGEHDISSDFTIGITVLDTRIFRDATGFYDFSNASTTIKTAFTAAAEQYLLDHMIGGIPLYSDAQYVLVSDRLQSLSDVAIPFIGLRELFTPLSEDDSNVLLYDGLLGTVDEYTLRTVGQNALTTLNPYQMNDMNLDTYHSLLTGQLYRFIPSEEHVGYQITPSLAESLPEPVQAVTSNNGEVVSKTWRISLRDDLEWSYYRNAPSYVTDHTVDASDFVYGMRTALDEQWYRALNNGSSTFDYGFSVKNLNEYIDGDALWEDVGIKATDTTTLEIEFTTSLSEFEFIEWTINQPFTPVHQEMYEQLGNNYGNALNTIAYSGPYKMFDFIEDELIMLKRNDNHPLQDTYPHTYISYELLEQNEYEVAFNEGRLDVVPVSVEDGLKYVGTNALIRYPGSTTMRLNINGFGTLEAQQAVFPDSNYVPEPLLSNELFKQAMYYAIERDVLVSFMNSGHPTMNYFNDRYIIDPYTGIPFRYTEEGQAINDDRFIDNYGYNVALAQQLFLEAIQEEINDGHYSPGTKENPTIIELDLYYFGDSLGQVSLFNLIEDEFEVTFKDIEHHIEVDVLPKPTNFPSIYTDYVNKGEFDLAIGGVSGSVWDMVGLLNIFRSDNASGYTMNYGFDTSIPNITVEYYDPVDNEVYVEEWSYDAISTVLNRGAYIYKGQEAVINMIQILDASSNSIMLELETLDGAPFVDLTYTVFEYNIDTDQYDLIEELQNVPLSDNNTFKPGIQFRVEGLEPYMYSLTPSGNYIYQGDYVVEINYSFTGSTIDFSITSPWMLTDEFVSVANKFVTNTTIEGNVVLHDDATTQTISSIKVYDQTTGLEAENTTLTIELDTNFTIEGLTSGTEYILEITLSDGFTQYMTFETSNFSNGEE